MLDNSVARLEEAREARAYAVATGRGFPALGRDRERLLVAGAARRHLDRSGLDPATVTRAAFKRWADGLDARAYAIVRGYFLIAAADGSAGDGPARTDRATEGGIR